MTDVLAEARPGLGRLRWSPGLVRAGATAVAAARAGVGLVALVRPEFAAGCWLGDRHGRGPAAKLLGRALGGRDVALAIGALVALRAGGPADRRRWLVLGGLADSVDALATVACWRSLPRARRVGVVVASAGAAVIGLLAGESVGEQSPGVAVE